MLKRKLVILAVLLIGLISCGALLACTKHVHTFDKWEKDANEHWKVCSECGKEYDKQTHDFGNDYEYDNTSHWKVCECGERASEGTHTFVEDVCSTCWFSKGLKYEAVNNGEAYFVVSLGGAFEEDLEIPSSYNGKPVIGIGEKAFYWSMNLKSVKIPESITYIGNSAFQGCTELTSISLPGTLTYVGSYAFQGCDNLSLTEEGTARYLGNSANPHLILIEATAANIKSCTINEATKIIAGSAFRGCSELKSITIPNSVESIGEWAFDDCINLTSVTIGNSVKSIEEGAFQNCANITSITIPASVTEIKNSAFYLCYKLVEIHNLSKIEIVAGSSKNGSIGLYAWNVYGATGESKLTSQNDFVFYNGEETVLLGYLGDQNEIELPENGSYSIYDYAFYMHSHITKVVISDSATSIGANAFHGCYNLVSVTIGKNVAKINDKAFATCHKLVEVYNLSDINISAGSLANGGVGHNVLDLYTDKEEVSKITTANDFLFYNGEETVLLGYFGKQIEIELPSEEQEYAIYKYAFYKDANLEEITIPANVTKIGEHAFSDCVEFKTVTIIGEMEIDETAFKGCYIENATIPGYAATNIKNSALTTVVVTNGDLPESAFAACKNLTTVTLNGDIINIGNEAFSGCTGIEEIVIPEGVVSIGNSVFSNCSALKTVTIPSTLKNIGLSAFSACTSLTALSLESVETIGNTAFRNCSSLETLTFGDNLISIGTGAIIGCNALKYTEDNGVNYLGSASNPYLILAAVSNKEITSYTVNASTKFIFHSAFLDCQVLENLTIGTSVKFIGVTAFYGCYKLTKLNYSGSKEQWDAIEKADNWNNGTEYTIEYAN